VSKCFVYYGDKMCVICAQVIMVSCSMYILCELIQELKKFLIIAILFKFREEVLWYIINLSIIQMYNCYNLSVVNSNVSGHVSRHMTSCSIINVIGSAHHLTSPPPHSPPQHRRSCLSVPYQPPSCNHPTSRDTLKCN